jgi:hypothetical protein
MSCGIMINSSAGVKIMEQTRPALLTPSFILIFFFLPFRQTDIDRDRLQGECERSDNSRGCSTSPFPTWHPFWTWLPPFITTASPPTFCFYQITPPLPSITKKKKLKKNSSTSHPVLSLDFIVILFICLKVFFKQIIFFLLF